jgi:outer membrane biosynthesis protein TonB
MLAKGIFMQRLFLCVSHGLALQQEIQRHSVVVTVLEILATVVREGIARPFKQRETESNQSQNQSENQPEKQPEKQSENQSENQPQSKQVALVVLIPVVVFQKKQKKRQAWINATPQVILRTCVFICRY